jgi:hypothetical protein
MTALHTALVSYFEDRGSRPCNVWSDTTGESGFAVYFDGEWWSVAVLANGTWTSKVTTFSDDTLAQLRVGD